jgi:hypothetical protein
MDRDMPKIPKVSRQQSCRVHQRDGCHLEVDRGDSHSLTSKLLELRSRASVERHILPRQFSENDSRPLPAPRPRTTKFEAQY